MFFIYLKNYAGLWCCLRCKKDTPDRDSTKSTTAGASSKSAADFPIVYTLEKPERELEMQGEMTRDMKRERFEIENGTHSEGSCKKSKLTETTADKSPIVASDHMKECHICCEVSEFVETFGNCTCTTKPCCYQCLMAMLTKRSDFFYPHGAQEWQRLNIVLENKQANEAYLCPVCRQTIHAWKYADKDKMVPQQFLRPVGWIYDKAFRYNSTFKTWKKVYMSTCAPYEQHLMFLNHLLDYHQRTKATLDEAIKNIQSLYPKDEKDRELVADLDSQLEEQRNNKQWTTIYEDNCMQEIRETQEALESLYASKFFNIKDGGNKIAIDTEDLTDDMGKKIMEEAAEKHTGLPRKSAMLALVGAHTKNRVIRDHSRVEMFEDLQELGFEPMREEENLSNDPDYVEGED